MQPTGELVIRTLAMPADTNPIGDIFGGWVLSQMDIAGAVFAKKLAHNRVVTIALDAMTFLNPVGVGDVLCCYADVVHKGKTSLGVKVEAWVVSEDSHDRVKVTEGTFTYVAIDRYRKPTPVKWDA